MASQVFTTTGSQTWNWPAGVASVEAEAIGGGGGSGTASGNPATGGGGKGGSYAKVTVWKGADTFLTIVVGTGGAIAGAGAASTIVQAGTTVLLAPGGGGGASMATSSANGAGGTTTNGTAVAATSYAGGNGGTGNFTSGVQGSGAGGGAAGPTNSGGPASVNVAGIAGTGLFLDGGGYQAAGKAGVGNTLAGLAGANYGGGASGGKANSNTDQAGKTGGQGIVVLTWSPPPDKNITGATIASTIRIDVPIIGTENPVPIVDVVPLTNWQTFGRDLAGYDAFDAQSFAGHTGWLTSIGLRWDKAGSPTDAAVAEIRKGTGTWDPIVATAASIPGSSLGPVDTWGWYKVALNTPVFLDGSAFILRIYVTRAVVDTANYWRLGKSNDVYAGGVAVYSPTEDLSFRLYTAPGSLGAPLTVELGAPPLVTTGATIGSSAVANAPANVEVLAPPDKAVTTVARPSTAVLYTPTLVPQAVAVTAARVLSTLALFAATVVPGAVTITAARVLTTAALFVPAVVPQAVTITAAHRSATSGVFAPSVSALAGEPTIGGAHIGTAPPGAFPPSVLVGPVLAHGATIAPTSVAYALTVTAAPVAVTGVHVGSTVALFAPTVTPPIPSITTPGLAPTSVLFGPTVVVLPITIDAGTITSTAVAFAPALVAHEESLLAPFMCVHLRVEAATARMQTTAAEVGLLGEGGATAVAWSVASQVAFEDETGATVRMRIKEC